MKPKLLGFQCQFDSAEAAKYNRLVLPTAWMAINVVKAEWLQGMVDDNPEAHRIFRHHPNRPWADDPERQAREAVAHIAGMMGPSRRFFTHLTDNNEFIKGKDHAGPELVAVADRYSSTFVRIGRAELGMATCAGNFNTGHWGAETANYYPLTLQAIQEDNEAHPERPSVIAWHEYNWPLFRDDEHWHTGKFLRAMPPILEDYPAVLGMLTEVGIDRAARVERADHLGWRGAHDDFATAVDWYCGEQGLFWLNKIMLECGYMVAALIFGCGMVDPWRPKGFDIMHNENDTAVLDRIKLYPGWSPPEPPPEPPTNGGDDMEGVRVFAWDEEADRHVELFGQDAVDLVSKKYGAAFRRADVAPGQEVYRLTELWEKTGHHSLVTQVLDEDGNPMANVDVALYWPDAPDPPEPPTEVYDHDWYRRFVHGPTGGNGDVGPGMGTGAYHGEGEGGPHAVWVRDPHIPSDICEKLGMLAGTFHDHLDQKFKRETVGEEPPPPAKGQFVEASRTYNRTEATNRIVMEIEGEVDFYDTRVHLVVGDDPDNPDWTAPEPISPVALNRYSIPTQYNPVGDEPSRTFWVVIQTPQGQPLSEPMGFEFRTNEYGIYTVEIEWRPEDQPPPDDRLEALAELFDGISALFKQCATVLRG